MSFISILKKIGGVLIGTEQVAEPVVKALVPASVPVFAVLDPIFARIQSQVINQEATAPSTTTGNAKADAVIADFETGLDIAQSIAEAEGKTVTYDKPELQAGITALVEAYKHFAAVKASIKTVPTVAAAATS